MRKIAIAGIAAGSLAFGVGGTLAAQAATATNTSTTTNTLISAKCYHHHATRSTTFHWVSAHNRYEVYASPHKGTSDYNTCHK
jgi:hypothetical protein